MCDSEENRIVRQALTETRRQLFLQCSKIKAQHECSLEPVDSRPILNNGVSAPLRKSMLPAQPQWITPFTIGEKIWSSK